MGSYKVLMSTLGRSHFIVAASNIIRQGVDLKLLQGWVPKDLNSWKVRMAAKIIGRKSFVAGLAKRRTPELEGRTISEPFPEMIQTALCAILGRFGRQLHGLSVRLAFACHGFLTRRHLKGYDVFHVKSGLGRGGAIRKAKALGMKVLVDHCVPHPLSMKATTGEDGYDNWWSFWRSVMADCNEADLVMVGSQYVKDTFVEYGFQAERIRVVPLAVLPIFSKIKTSYSSSGRLELIYTGNWGHWKGVDDLIDSVEILKERGLDIHLTVVGSVIKSSNSYGKAIKNNLPVTFVGHVPQDALREYLKEADVYVFPSLRDGFAVSAFEGMSAGLCLVTTRESSIPIQDGETGFYVKSHSPGLIADRVEYLYNHRDIVERVGRNAADCVEKNYSWERYAQNVKRVYDELLAK